MTTTSASVDDQVVPPLGDAGAAGSPAGLAESDAAVSAPGADAAAAGDGAGAEVAAAGDRSGRDMAALAGPDLSGSAAVRLLELYASGAVEVSRRARKQIGSILVAAANHAKDAAWIEREIALQRGAAELVTLEDTTGSRELGWFGRKWEWFKANRAMLWASTICFALGVIAVQGQLSFYLSNPKLSTLTALMFPVGLELASWFYGFMASRLIDNNKPSAKMTRKMWQFAAFQCAVNTFHSLAYLHDWSIAAVQGLASLFGPVVWHSYTAVKRELKSGRTYEDIRASRKQRVLAPFISLRAARMEALLGGGDPADIWLLAQSAKVRVVRRMIQSQVREKIAGGRPELSEMLEAEFGGWRWLRRRGKNEQTKAKADQAPTASGGEESASAISSPWPRVGAAEVAGGLGEVNAALPVAGSGDIGTVLRQLDLRGGLEAMMGSGGGDKLSPGRTPSASGRGGPGAARGDARTVGKSAGRRTRTEGQSGTVSRNPSGARTRTDSRNGAARNPNGVPSPNGGPNPNGAERPSDVPSPNDAPSRTRTGSDARNRTDAGESKTASRSGRRSEKTELVIEKLRSLRSQPEEFHAAAATLATRYFNGEVGASLIDKTRRAMQRGKYGDTFVPKA